MREILFKAKRVDNGEWCYGVPLVEGWSKTTYIASYEYTSLAFVQQIEVDPETLCEYTQLKDKNGKRIWENDIVATKPLNEIAVGYKNNYIGKVIWTTEDVGSCGCCYPSFKGCGFVLKAKYERLKLTEDCKVIGNIFDNSELLAER